MTELSPVAQEIMDAIHEIIAHTTIADSLHPESPHQLFTPPAPKGYWLLQQSSCGHIQFAIYKKPNRLHRLMAKFLLGWDWRDND